jgi:hypothetical protein
LDVAVDGINGDSVVLNKDFIFCGGSDRYWLHLEEIGLCGCNPGCGVGGHCGRCEASSLSCKFVEKRPLFSGICDLGVRRMKI